MEAVLATATAEEWTTRLAAAGLPAGPVNTIPEAIAFAESIGLDPTVVVSGSPETKSIRSPIRLSESPARYDLSPPRLGEHPETTWLTARTAQER
jgi:crotonobetainyl-CoA:carnitine CoA-transferase CaiB-like acyl-CoA transferase